MKTPPIGLIRKGARVKGYTVHTQATTLNAENLNWMVGRKLERVTFTPPSTWWIWFFGGGSIGTQGMWRLLDSKGVQACSIDQAPSFDAGSALLNIVDDAAVTAASVRDSAPDLAIHFGSDLLLEIFALYAGYECWQTRDPNGRCVVVLGSRDASTWQEP